MKVVADMLIAQTNGRIENIAEELDTLEYALSCLLGDKEVEETIFDFKVYILGVKRRITRLTVITEPDGSTTYHG